MPSTAVNGFKQPEDNHENDSNAAKEEKGKFLVQVTKNGHQLNISCGTKDFNPAKIFGFLDIFVGYF